MNDFLYNAVNESCADAFENIFETAFENAPPHEFSPRHNKKMQKIFAKYRKNSQNKGGIFTMTFKTIIAAAAGVAVMAGFAFGGVKLVDTLNANSEAEYKLSIPEGNYYLGGDKNSDMYIHIENGRMEALGDFDKYVELEMAYQHAQAVEIMSEYDVLHPWPDDEYYLELSRDIVASKTKEGELTVWNLENGETWITNHPAGGSGYAYDGKNTLSCEFGKFIRV